MFLWQTYIPVPVQSAQKVFDQTWLNTNHVSMYYSPKFFMELMERKEKNNFTATGGTAVEYVQLTAIAAVDESLKKVESIPEKPDTKELVQSSLDVFRYADEIFKTEYLEIAAMIDAEKPSEEINAAIDKLFAMHDGEMRKRFKQLDSYAIPYAEKHDIPIKK